MILMPALLRRTCLMVSKPSLSGIDQVGDHKIRGVFALDPDCLIAVARLLDLVSCAGQNNLEHCPQLFVIVYEQDV